MNLDELEADREIDPNAPLSLPEKEICDRYEKVFTAAVNDALREKRLTNQTLPNGLVPLRERMRSAGFAFTIKGAKNLTLKNEMAECSTTFRRILSSSGTPPGIVIPHTGANA